MLTPGVTSYHDETPSQIRQIIAKRLLEAKTTIPHYYLTIDVEMDKVLQLRQRLNEASTSKLSVNDLIVKACAKSLRKVPSVNTAWMGDQIRYFDTVDISVAV